MSDIIQLSKLVNEILSEVGDLKGIQPVKWQRIADRYIFKVNENVVEVKFQKWRLREINDIIIPSVENKVFQAIASKHSELLLNSYNLGYRVNGEIGQAIKSNINTLYTILSTIVAISKDFISTNDPFIITIFSSSKFGGLSNDKQKDLIYAEILKQHLPDNYYLRDIHIKEMYDGDLNIENLKGLILFKRK
jgi:hypothetical protein